MHPLLAKKLAQKQQTQVDAGRGGEPVSTVTSLWGGEGVVSPVAAVADLKGSHLSSSALPSSIPSTHSVGRIVIESLGGFKWGVHDMEHEERGESNHALQQVLRTLWNLRNLLQSDSMRNGGGGFVAMVSIPTGIFRQEELKQIKHLAQGLIRFEAVSDASQVVRLAPDSASCAGVMQIERMPNMSALTGGLKDAHTYLIRYRRKGISIRGAEIDPDVEATGPPGRPSSSSIDF